MIVILIVVILTAIDKSNLQNHNSNTKLKIIKWMMIETSRPESIKRPKTTDFLKELMSSKETEKMSDNNSHISSVCLLKKKLSFFNPSMEKYPHNSLRFLPTQYHTTADQANLFIKQERFKVHS